LVAKDAAQEEKEMEETFEKEEATAKEAERIEAA